MTRIKCPPFCKRNCIQKHHDLLLAVLNIPSENKGSKKNDSNGGLEEFESVVQSYLKKGWQKNDVVPDAVEDYRFPLVHWTSVLGKTKALEWLIKHGFDPNVRAPTTKETALHRSLLCLELSEMFLNRKMLERKVEVQIDLLKNCLILKDRSMDTPLHVVARQLLEGRRKDHFEDCIKLMLAKLKEFYPEQFNDIINAQNSVGDSVVHILACSEDAFCGLRMVINEGAVTSTTNMDGKTPLDVATERGSIKATALLKRLTDERMSNQTDDADLNGVTDEASNDEEEEQSTKVNKTSNLTQGISSDLECSCRIKREHNYSNEQRSQDNSTNTLNLDQNINLLGALRATGLWGNVKELANKKKKEDEKVLASKLEELQATNEAIEDAKKVVEDTITGITSKEKELERIKKEVEKAKKELSYMENEQHKLKRKRSSLNNDCSELEKRLHYCDSLLKVHEPQQESQNS
ncbi:uncharacterized protein LOC116306346 isoform X1 [Actinia tenebrosa]|uniref:Uncharacterized protein LOC116306346 isoform X1 n=1 Tax=Actinia tenebrosa TaxID=6105 RepID=A0A6P8IYJ9_ACTTE|nr:uncharacterized protein LOC116306346 isoform X1 [Actinia tenebrosa]